MGFLTMPSVWLRRRDRATPALNGPSRFQAWAYCSGSALRRLEGRGFTIEEARFAERWAQAQKTVWGWHAEVKAGPDGKPCLLTCAGGEDTDIEWLVYRCENGFQTDEWCGASHWSATLEDALAAFSTPPRAADVEASTASEIVHDARKAGDVSHQHVA